MASTAQPTSWRSLLKIHPAAEMFPLMSPEELRVLGEDIKANRLRVPIELFSNQRNTLSVLDGRNRLDAMELVGYRFSKDEKGRLDTTDPDGKSVYMDWRYRTDNPYDFVVSANIHRRHLTGAQKGELIAALLKADPTKSDRAIAETAKTSHVTVAAKRAKLEATGQIDQLTERTGKDGKTRKSKKPLVDKAVALADDASPANASVQPAQPTTKASAPQGTTTISGEDGPAAIEEASALDSIKSTIRQWWTDAGEADRLAFGQWFDDLRMQPQEQDISEIVDAEPAEADAAAE